MEKTHNNQSREPATKGDLQAAVSDLRGMMTDMMEELTATHEDVRYVRNTVTMLVKSDAAHEAALESLRTRVERVERKVGIAK
jgi:chaperonin cofactor prefoldin